MEEKTTLKRSISDLEDIGIDCGPESIKKIKINGVPKSEDDGLLSRNDGHTTVRFDAENGDDSGIISGGGDSPYKERSSDTAAADVSDVNHIGSSTSTASNLGQGDEKTTIERIPSLQRDAEVIVSVVPNVDVSTVYQKLATQRKNPNRMNAVTTDLFENPPREQKDEYTSSSNQDKKKGIYEDVKAVVKAVKAVAPSMKLNPAEIYVLLERHSEDADRTSVVADLFLQDVKENPDSSDINLFDDVQAVLSKVKDANPDYVYTMLESLVSHRDRVKQVIENLNSCSKPSLKKDDSVPNDPALRNDPVFMDMRKIAKMFPDMDRNEIYAYIEAHHGKKDRVQVVIDEILRSSKGSLGSSLSVTSDRGETTLGKPVFRGVCGIQGEVDELREIFPDCDPNYLFEQLEQRANDAERVKNLATQMFENRNYPKLKDVVEKQQKIIKQKEIRNLKFDMKTFLSKFPAPVEFFYKTDTPMSDIYKDHCLAYVKNEFEWFKDGYLKKVLAKHNHHLAPALRELTDVKADFQEEMHHTSKRLRLEPRHKRTPYPDEPDERFYHELLFSQNEQKIKDHFYMLELERKRKVSAARKNGELYECGCCFDDEVLFEELSACSDGHLFCRECIRRSTESALGEGKTKFPCLTGDCEFDIPLSVLQGVLSAAMFSRLLSRLQEEEIRLADIPDLVSCPFCSFATVMADPEDKVFKCLNPECLKETCRLCKEPNHVPLKCNEVEKQGETSMRTYIENRISEAMLRTCHRCKKRFFKDYGCNKMTCTCGATMCYVCREPDIDYDHFNHGNTCNNTEDANKIHLKEMEEAATQAKEQYIREHPEAAEQALKYDPREHVENFRKEGGFQDGSYDEEGSDGYDSDDIDNSERYYEG